MESIPPKKSNKPLPLKAVSRRKLQRYWTLIRIWETLRQSLDVRRVKGDDPDYFPLQVLGQGGFGKVFLVREVSSGRVLACKEINATRKPRDKNDNPSYSLSQDRVKKLEEMIKTELQALWRLNGYETIATFTGDVSVDTETDIIRIYLEYYPGGSLKDLLNQRLGSRRHIATVVVLSWAYDIAQALLQCHRVGYLHRDIAPGNVLLKSPYQYEDLVDAIARGDKTPSPMPARMRYIAKNSIDLIPNCCVSDFGLGYRVSESLSNARNAPVWPEGSPHGKEGFMAPEVNGDVAKWTPAADIFSFGVTIYCICNLEPKPPTSGKLEQISDRYPKVLRDLVDRCVDHDSTKRPTTAEVVSVLLGLVQTHGDDFASKCPEIVRETGSIADPSLAIAILVICLACLVWIYISQIDKSWLIFLEGKIPAWLPSVLERLWRVVFFGVGVWLGVFISGSGGARYEILLADS